MSDRLALANAIEDAGIMLAAAGRRGDDSKSSRSATVAAANQMLDGSGSGYTSVS